MSFFKSNNRTGCTIWLTGLSASGKTTIAKHVREFLMRYEIPVVHLDGDGLRKGLNKDLKFSKEDRCENIRRVAEVAALFAANGSIALVSLISPYAEYRRAAREIHNSNKLKFFEVYVNTPIKVCESRDPKGLYKGARDNSVPEFTGISAPYEAPTCPDLLIESGIYAVVDCRNKILRFLVEHRLVPSAIIDAVDRHNSITERIDLVDASKMLPKINLDTISLQWAQVIAEGWATPLEGFMREQELLECLHFKTLTMDRLKHSQSIPIVLPIHEDDRRKIKDFKSVCLTYSGREIGLLTDVEYYEDRKKERCARTFGSVDPEHPSIRMIMESDKNWLLGGKIQLFERITWEDGLDRYRLTPKEIRNRLYQMGADAAFVFQVRNPLHNGHLMLIQETFEKLRKSHKKPVLILHPIGGWTKDDDVPLAPRIKQHQVLIDEGLLKEEETILAIFPSPMSYAGPTEVQWHAKGRLVTGIDHYIVGRDPAGIKDPSNPNRDFYDPSHGAKVLQMTPGLQNLKIIPFKVAALNTKKNKMEFLDSNSNPNDFENISGTKMRQMARDGQDPPEAFMNLKAWAVLSDYYKTLAKK